MDIAIVRVDTEDVDPMGDGLGDIAMQQFVRANSDDEQQYALRQLEQRDQKKCYGSVRDTGRFAGTPGGHRVLQALRAAFFLAFFSLRGRRCLSFFASLGIFWDFLGSATGVASTATSSAAAFFFGI